MKVILITNMKKLGKIGDVVTVKNGYGRNFLLPNKRAIAFSKENFSVFEAQRQQFVEANEQQLKDAQEAMEIIKKIHVNVIENAGEDGKLYGSVTPGVIAAVINAAAKKQGGAKRDLVDKNVIVLENSIKTTGLYKITLDLHSDVSFKKEIVVARSETEVAAVIKAAKDDAKRAQDEKRKEEEIAATIAAANGETAATIDATVETAAVAETATTTEVVADALEVNQTATEAPAAKTEN